MTHCYIYEAGRAAFELLMDEVRAWRRAQDEADSDRLRAATPEEDE